LSQHDEQTQNNRSKMYKVDIHYSNGQNILVHY